VAKETVHNRYRNLFFVSLSFIVLFACVAFYFLYQSQQTQYWNEHRRRIDNELGGVLSGTYEMTASVRGYMLTGRIESIVTYDETFAEIQTHLQNVYTISKDDKSLASMADTLGRLIKVRKDLLDEMMEVYKISKYSKDTMADEKIHEYVSKGDELLNQIRIQVKAMGAYELYLYKQKVNTGDNFNNLAYILISCFGLLTIFVSLYGYRVIQKENKQKQAAEFQLNESYDQVQKANIMLTEAEKIAKMGSWEWNIRNGKVYWSDGAYKVYNLSPETYFPSFKSFMLIVHEEDKGYVLDTINKAIEKKISYQIQFREIASKENRIVFAVGIPRLDEKGDLESYFGVIMDVTQQSNYEKQLEDFNNALKKSNEELEQFAYAASHDLQEPLRKIRAFGDRLILKFGTDKEIPGQEYVFRMMDGAERMQVLIQDLLAFSRVSRDVGDKVSVDLNDIVKTVLDDLQLSISETNAKFEMKELPKLTTANPVQMHQLFLNIIGNAIKFSRKDLAPEIRISVSTIRGNNISLPDEKAIPQKTYYQILIRDNGIGFDEKYLDKMFTIFQRLHGRNEYKGTGIGLAICKKICKNHNGFITAKSDGNSGADFIIYLPK